MANPSAFRSPWAWMVSVGLTFSVTACSGLAGEAEPSGSSGTSGQAGGIGLTGMGGSGGSAAGGAAGPSGVPCDVASLLSSKCVVCHGTTPLPGVPTSLVTYADLAAPSKSNPGQTNAALAVARMMDTATPMPPAGSTAATPAEIAALQGWIAAGYPMTECGTGTVSDPFAVAPACTSMTTWKGGRDGSGAMDPGMACVSCHATTGGEAPRFAIAGTVYPTAHEPDLCDGANGANGAKVVITGADGTSMTLAPNASGNFYFRGTIAAPYSAKVTYMGRERTMLAQQTSGDCNACHTQSGAMTAPGRILLP